MRERSIRTFLVRKKSCSTKVYTVIVSESNLKKDKTGRELWLNRTWKRRDRYCGSSLVKLVLEPCLTFENEKRMWNKARGAGSVEFFMGMVAVQWQHWTSGNNLLPTPASSQRTNNEKMWTVCKSYEQHWGSRSKRCWEKETFIQIETTGFLMCEPHIKR